MRSSSSYAKGVRHLLRSAGILVAAAMAPAVVLAQASPFLTGATALQANLLAWLTPIAIILVMVLGTMAMANRIAQVLSRRIVRHRPRSAAQRQ